MDLVFPTETIASILAFIPQPKRYFCRQVSTAWRAIVDGSVTQLDLSRVAPPLDVFTYNIENKIIRPNVEKMSKAEHVLLTAAKNFKNLKKIKVGGHHKLVRETYIGYPVALGRAERGDDGEAYPLLESIAIKRALPDFAPVLQDTEVSVAKHKQLIETVLWTDFSLKRVRDDIDPLVIVHLVKNCPKLTELQLYGITRVMDDILAAIVDLRPNITQLNLINTSVSVMGLEYALKNLPNLEKLSIGRTISSGYLLCGPHKNFPHTKMLQLKDLPAWQRLRKLRLSYSSIQDLTPLLAQCTNLEKFHDVGVNAPMLSIQCSFPKMISLDVSYCHFDIPQLLQKHPHIEHVSLRGDLNDSHINAIFSSVTKLTKLRLSVFYDSQISDAALVPVLKKHANTLTSLELCGLRTVSPAVLDIEFPALKTLGIKLCSQISGKHVAKLIPPATTEKYENCFVELMHEDVENLGSALSYPAFSYYDSETGFVLRSEIGMPMDPAYW